MSRKKIKNPLIKRIPKEIIGDWKKYLVVFLFLVLTIGFVSGMYVANDSMLTSADEGVSKYKQEDGHFELKDKADSELVTAIESGEVKTAPDEKDSDSSKTPVTLYENFYRNEDEDYDADGKKDGTIRVYTKTGDINLACLIEGSFPQNENEIAVDRMHADNVGMKVGDTIKVSGKEFKVSGLIAYVNYSTLHEKKTDMMFDAIKFDVAMVTKEGFDRLDKSIHYAYAWKYEDEPADDIEQKEKSDNFLEAMVSQVMAAGNEVEDYTPRYSNPAINFATDDMGSDKAMGGVLLDILIVIIAFIFAVTISNTIANESSAIGTLRASGYTKGELISHYISMPVIVTLLAAVVGNILGYMIKLSDEETALLTPYENPDEAANYLLDHGIKIVAVTLGKEGVLICNRKDHQKVSGFSSQVVDTTGAGDSFWGGFMSQFVKSKLNPEDCSIEELKKFARYGNAVASLCIEKKGGILSIPEEKETFKRLQLSV